VGVGFPVVELASGYSHVCARSAAGEVRCWGSDFGGVLGRGVSASLDCLESEYETFSCAVNPACCVGDDEPPSSVLPLELGGPATQISGTCALLVGGLVRCWGENDRGQLGLGHTENIGDDEVPASAEPISIGGPALQISSSGHRSCALLAGGEVRCWGLGSFGGLGYGNLDNIGDDELPSDVGPVSLGGPAVEVVVGYAQTCAIRADGALLCWGRGDWSSLGYGNLENVGDDELPSDVGPIDLGLPVRQVSAGFTSCAVLDDGLVRCWGSGLRGQLGNGQTGACIGAGMCSAGPECCLGDAPGEMPPAPVVLF
jgi:alpha-tubulin suppressor-like RCC1 family protein